MTHGEEWDRVGFLNKIFADKKIEKKRNAKMKEISILDIADVSLGTPRLPGLRGQEFIEMNPVESLSYEKLNKLKKTIEASELRIEVFQNHRFVKVKQIAIPDMLPRLVTPGRYLLLLPESAANSLKLINYDSSMQMLLYMKVIEDIQAWTKDIESTIIGPIRAIPSDIGLPKRSLEGMRIEDFAAISHGTESEFDNATIDNFKYQITDSVK